MDDERVVEVRKLEGWLTTWEVAALFGITKQAVHWILWHSTTFNVADDVRALCFSEGRTVWILRESAVMAEKARRDAAAAAKEAAPTVAKRAKPRVKTT